jgi:hypothetical protein
VHQGKWAAYHKTRNNPTTTHRTTDSLPDDVPPDMGPPPLKRVPCANRYGVFFTDEHTEKPSRCVRKGVYTAADNYAMVSSDISPAI